MIRVPAAVDRETTTFVRTAYKEAARDANDDELGYIHKKIPAVLDGLRKHGGWQTQLAGASEGLYELLEEHDNLLSEDDRSHIIAALFYLCDPFDIIPDYTPGIGYIDDAIVINACLARLRRCSKKAYSRVLAHIAR